MVFPVNISDPGENLRKEERWWVSDSLRSKLAYLFLLGILCTGVSHWSHDLSWCLVVGFHRLLQSLSDLIWLVQVLSSTVQSQKQALEPVFGDQAPFRFTRCYLLSEASDSSDPWFPAILLSQCLQNMNTYLKTISRRSPSTKPERACSKSTGCKFYRKILLFLPANLFYFNQNQDIGMALWIHFP